MENEIKRRGLAVTLGYTNEFVDFWESLKEKYPEEIFRIQGVHNDNFDISKFSKNFFKKSASVASVSVDANANVKEKSIAQYIQEYPKGLQRLNSFYQLFKWVKKVWGVKYAKIAVEKVLNGELAINDFSNFSTSYCYAFDLRMLLMEGMNFFKGGMKINAPKRSDSFVALLIQTTAFISNQIMGACSYPDCFVAWDWFLRNEHGQDYMKRIRAGEDDVAKKKILDQFQNLIYSFNFPFRSSQSAFTNLSVMDKGYMKSLFGEYWLPDGTLADLDSSQELSKLFFEYFNSINGKEGMFTFPVMTLSISLDQDGNYIDPDFKKWASKYNCTKSFSNVFIGEPDIYSSCCFSGEQLVLVKVEREIHLLPIKEVEKLSKNGLRVFHNGSWVSAKFVKLKQNRDMYEVITSNGKKLVVTDNHINLTQRGDVETKNLIAGKDYLAFNTRALSTYPEANRHLTYEQGFLIGAYLGDGSKARHDHCNSAKVIFSLSLPKLHIIDKIKIALKQWGIDKEVHINEGEHNVISAIVQDVDLLNIIEEYVQGDYAPEKSLNPLIFSQSVEFRKGILDGLYATDGGNSNRIYSSSKNLIRDIEVLCTTLGYNTRVDIDTRRDHGCIRGKKVNTNYDIYCLRWYNSGNKRSMGDEFKVINNTEYFLIESIQQVAYADEYVYCFNVNKEDEPYFTLPNGVITHNCRLSNNIKKAGGLGFQNSFGVGGLSLGSHRVAVLNLARISLLEKDNPNILEEDIEMLHKILYAHRKLIKEKISKGVMPLYTSEWISINRQYSTIGITACNQYVANKGLDIKTQEGIDCIYRVLKAIETNIEKWQAEEAEESCIYNLEAIPAESMAVRLAQTDRLLGYNDKYEIYSNQYIDLMEDCPIYERFKVQGQLDQLTSGGNILHCNIDGEKPLTPEQYEKIIDLAKDCKVKYFGINYAYSECAKRHYTIGKNKKCPICGEPIVETWCRVVGFITPKSAFNPVRRDFEFDRRVFYEADKVDEATNKELANANC